MCLFPMMSTPAILAALIPEFLSNAFSDKHS